MKRFGPAEMSAAGLGIPPSASAGVCYNRTVIIHTCTISVPSTSCSPWRSGTNWEWGGVERRLVLESRILVCSAYEKTISTTWEGSMRKTLEVLVLIVGTCCTIPARAGDVTPVKCGPNQDRVWVYDSLTSFDVQSKIRCDETVEIVGHVKGFVKVRLRDGSEGYVPDSSLPDVSPQVDIGGKPTDANAADSTISLGSIARRVAARPVAAPTHPTDTSHAIPNTGRSTVTLNTGLVRSPTGGENLTGSLVVAPAVAVAPSSGTVVPNSNLQPAPSIRRSVNTAASVGTMHPTPSRESAAATASATSTVHPNAKSAPSASNRAIEAGAKSDIPQPPAGTALPIPPVSNLGPALLKPALASNAATVADISAALPAGETPNMRPVSTAVDADELPGFQPMSDSADPACQSFFSAYGLAPSQLRWVAQNRKKLFPSICPAPDPSKVDFVVIFAHDVDDYNSALPVPVHTDRNGFSDFSPMVGVDTALMSSSSADKARHEFVWVFLMKRGAFDPAAFSPRRRYQFMKVESNSLGSKAGVKTIEDAFQFVARQGPSQ